MAWYGPRAEVIESGPNAGAQCGCCPQAPCIVWEDDFTGTDGDPPNTTYWDVSDAAVEIDSDALLIPVGEWAEMIQDDIPQWADAVSPDTGRGGTLEFFMELTGTDEVKLEQTTITGSVDVWFDIFADEIVMNDDLGVGGEVTYATGTGNYFRITDSPPDTTDNSGGRTFQRATTFDGLDDADRFVIHHPGVVVDTAGVTDPAYRWTSTVGDTKIDDVVKTTNVYPDWSNPSDCPEMPFIAFCPYFTGLLDDIGQIDWSTPVEIDPTFSVEFVSGVVDGDGCDDCASLDGETVLYEPADESNSCVSEPQSDPINCTTGTSGLEDTTIETAISVDSPSVDSSYYWFIGAGWDGWSWYLPRTVTGGFFDPLSAWELTESIGPPQDPTNPAHCDFENALIEVTLL